MSPCEHTLHLTDQEGRPTGSWIDERTEHGVRVVCRTCGKFYGYRRRQHAAGPKQPRSGGKHSVDSAQAVF